MSASGQSVFRDISRGSFDDPFSVLGLHEAEGQQSLTVFHPDADKVEAFDAETGKVIATLLLQPDAPGVFHAASGQKDRFSYRLRFSRGSESWEADDAYRFGPVLGELDEYLIGEGSHLRLWEKLGAHDFVDLPALEVNVYRLRVKSGIIEQTALVPAAPVQTPSLASRVGQDRVWGVTAALYGLRSML